MLVWWASAISTDRDSIVSFPICSATRSISFPISHFSAISTGRDSIIDLISHSMITDMAYG